MVASDLNLLKLLLREPSLLVARVGDRLLEHTRTTIMTDVILVLEVALVLVRSVPIRLVVHTHVHALASAELTSLVSDITRCLLIFIETVHQVKETVLLEESETLSQVLWVLLDHVLEEIHQVLELSVDRVVFPSLDLNSILLLAAEVLL